MSKIGVLDSGLGGMLMMKHLIQHQVVGRLPLKNTLKLKRMLTRILEKITFLKKEKSTKINNNL